MAYRITDGCVKCGCCELVCPNHAIREGEGTYVINPDRCTECVGAYRSSKCAEICPVEVPGPDPGRVEGREALLHKWRSLHAGETSRSS